MLLGGDEYFPQPERRGNVVAQAVKSSPAGGSSEAYALYLLTIESARASIDLASPYFTPDARILRALIAAARRGVRVSVLVAGEADNTVDRMMRVASRQEFGRALEGGIKIYEYRGAMLHSKTFVVDSVWGSVGSINLDNHSFALNHELNVTFYDRDIAGQLAAIFRKDLESAQEITYEAWKRRGAGRVLEWFLLPLRNVL